MRMQRPDGARDEAIVVEDAEWPEAHLVGVDVVVERKMPSSGEPATVRAVDLFRAANREQRSSSLSRAWRRPATYRSVRCNVNDRPCIIDPMTETLTPAPGLAASDPRLDAWRAFLQAHARLFRRLDEELREEHGLSLPEYEALMQIGRSPGRRVRMSQLAQQVLLSKSGVTRLVDRLVADGFVERSACSHDARGAEAVLTPSGLECLRSAAGTHLRGIDRYFVSAVSGEDLATLARTMRAVSSLAGSDTADAADADGCGSAPGGLAT
jgi:DNA-binding MarR family transcriptional regulator